MRLNTTGQFLSLM